MFGLASCPQERGRSSSKGNFFQLNAAAEKAFLDLVGGGGCLRLRWGAASRTSAEEERVKGGLVRGKARFQEGTFGGKRLVRGGGGEDLLREEKNPPRKKKWC